MELRIQNEELRITSAPMQVFAMQSCPPHPQHQYFHFLVVAAGRHEKLQTNSVRGMS
ncbi:MAG: hypothetical protein GXX09_11075 [Syntrophomonadaceae bacterium]|nr:hypothetical protein [Syntrophomonadaceae bacterium]